MPKLNTYTNTFTNYKNKYELYILVIDNSIHCSISNKKNQPYIKNQTKVI